MVAILCLCAVFVPNDLALAEESGWETGYNGYLSALGKNDAKDWYFGENYLDIEGASLIINAFLEDESFDKEALKNDPIIIAVIDSGIGYAYTTDGETETEPNPFDIYEEGVQYKLHPIFEDVLLKDEDGNYVYKNVVDELKIKDRNGGDIIETMTGIPQNEGDIAIDMVDNTSDNHGTHVTGIVALLIHKLGLEDYIKILPVKANTTLNYNESKNSYTAGYNSTYLRDEALAFCAEMGADIVSMSLTANSDDDGAYRYDEYADDMLIVAAAGNHDEIISGYRRGYPAAYNNVLGVMNYTKDNRGNPEIASTSNYGSWYDIVAPGTSIISSINGDEYGKLTGTSMATPITAFASALGYLRFRGYNNYDFGYDLNALSVRTMVSFGASRNITKGLGAYPMLVLTDILAYDFYGNVEFLELIGETPEQGDTLQSIDIIDLANAQYKIGGGETITLIANPTPANALKEDTLKWWCEIDEEKTLIGEGWTIEYAIPEQVGAYKIYCATVNEEGEEVILSTNQIDFEVIYRKPSELEILSDTMEYAVGGRYLFSVNTKYVNPDLDLHIEWYVNGVKKHEGDTFVYEPTEIDDYIISVKINGEEVDRMSLTSYSEDGWVVFILAALAMYGVIAGVKGLIVAIYVLIGLSVATGIAVLIIDAVRKRKKKNDKEE